MMKRIRKSQQLQDADEEEVQSFETLALVPRDPFHIPLTHDHIMVNLRAMYKMSVHPAESSPILILNDVIPNILSYCDGATLARAACVCHDWHDLCNRNELWENLCRQTFGVSADQLTPSPDPVKELYILSHKHLRAICDTLAHSSRCTGIRAIPNVIPMSGMRSFM